MKKQMTLAAALSGLVGLSNLAYADNSVLDKVQERGYVNCVIGNSFPGFYSLSKAGDWTGMDIDICRGVAAAVFGDKEKVKFLPVQWAQSFTSIKSGNPNPQIENRFEVKSF